MVMCEGRYDTTVEAKEKVSMRTKVPERARGQDVSGSTEAF
jgi:hypothetical protein